MIRDSRNGRSALVVVLVISVVLLVVAVIVWQRGGFRDADATREAMPGSAAVNSSDMGGMDMSSDGTLQLTTDQIQTFGITFGFAEERLLTNDMRSVGIVTVDESRVAQVTPRVSGYVERLQIAETGQRVTRGEPVATIYSPELLAAQQELLVAQRLVQEVSGATASESSRAGTRLLEAAKRRLRLWEVTDAQIEAVLRSGEAPRTWTVSAPVSGVVTERFVVEGQAISAGQPLLTITNLDQVWVDTELSDGQLADVRVGTPATVDITALPGRPFTGRVAFIHPTVDMQTRTVRARIELANTSGRLKPGMFATVRMESTNRRALTVPIAALFRTGRQTLVFVDLGDGRIAAQEVEVGTQGASFAEILAGIEPGQRVVTSAQYLLDSESNLADVMRAMMAQTGTADMQER